VARASSTATGRVPSRRIPLTGTGSRSPAWNRPPSFVLTLRPRTRRPMDQT